MTKLQNVNDLRKFMLGADDLWDRVFTMPHSDSHSYPRYNIINSPTGYRIEVAVPGWDKKDLTVELEKSTLLVMGEMQQDYLEEGESYTHKGLSTKNFKRTFSIGENLILDRAYLESGMLNIEFSKHVPEAELPKLIEML